MDTARTLGWMIPALRELGWSSAELARRLGVSPKTAARWGVAEGSEFPQYAVSYVLLALELRRFAADADARLSLAAAAIEKVRNSLPPDTYYRSLVSP